VAVAARPNSAAGASLRRLLHRLIRDEEGQDLVEYALLVAFFGVTFLLVWTSVVEAIHTSHGNTTNGVYDLWDPPDPGGTPQ
jgi:Flp pilus assembly pilin Flp